MSSLYLLSRATATTLLTTSQGATRSGLSVGEAILAVATIVGGGVGLWQVLTSAAARRRNRAINRIVEGMAERIDAERESERVDQLRQLVESLEDQIREVPAEARRLYLNDRSDALQSLIADQWQEYLAIQSELELSGLSTHLDPRIQLAIDSTVMPQRRDRIRREREVRVLLGLLVLFIVLPSALQPSQLIYGYFSTVYGASYTGWANILGSVIFGIAVLWFLMAWGLRRRPVRVLRRLLERHFIVRGVISMFLLGAGGCALFLAYTQLDEQAPYNSIHDYSIGTASLIATLSVALALTLLTLTFTLERLRHLILWRRVRG